MTYNNIKLNYRGVWIALSVHASIKIFSTYAIENSPGFTVQKNFCNALTPASDRNRGPLWCLLGLILIHINREVWSIDTGIECHAAFSLYIGLIDVYLGRVTSGRIPKEFFLVYIVKRIWYSINVLDWLGIKVLTIQIYYR